MPIASSSGNTATSPTITTRIVVGLAWSSGAPIHFTIAYTVTPLHSITVITPPQSVYAIADRAPIATEVPVCSRIGASVACLPPAHRLGTWTRDRGPAPSTRRRGRLARHVHLGLGAGPGQVERPVWADVRHVPPVGGGLCVGGRAARDAAPALVVRVPRVRARRRAVRGRHRARLHRRAGDHRGRRRPDRRARAGGDRP